MRGTGHRGPRSATSLLRRPTWLGGRRSAGGAEGVGRARTAFHLGRRSTRFTSRPPRLATIHRREGCRPNYENADTARWRARKAGAQLPVLHARHDRGTLERLTLGPAARRASNARFRAAHQPKIALATGEISGFEALLRWQHPQRGLVPPLKFISILEETGLIIRVGEWVAREACEQMLRWQAEGLPPRPIAVNVSARQFLQRDLDQVIGKVLSDTGVQAKWLESSSRIDAEERPGSRGACDENLRTMGVCCRRRFGTAIRASRLRRFPLEPLDRPRPHSRRHHQPGRRHHRASHLGCPPEAEWGGEGVKRRPARVPSAAHCDEMKG